MLTFKTKVVGVAVEPSYGVTGSPDATTAALRTINFSIRPLDFDTIEIPYDKSTLGANHQVLVGKHVSMTFEVPFSGAGGLADVVPPWSPLIRAAGHSETVNAATNVTYAPIDTGAPSLSLSVNIDSRRSLVLGARGALTGIRNSKRGFPVLQFEFRGLYTDPTNVAAPVPNIAAWVTPLPFSAANTSGTLFGETLPMHDFTVAGGQTVEFRETSESEQIQQSNRVSTFNVLFDEPLISAYNWYQQISQENVGILNMVHGTAVGNIVEVNAPNAQVTSAPEPEDQQNISAIRVQGNLQPSGATPEYSIISR